MKLLKNRQNNWPIAAILVLVVITRFGGLTWCFPYTPHPDEWNMAHAITQLNWREKLNPHFFAYGQFPLYLSYFSAVLYNFIPWIKIKTVNIQEAIFFLRFWSAVAGTGIVYLVYLISKKLFLTRPLIAPFLTVFTPGLIQISHFGTTESLLAFFFLLVLYLSFRILEKPKIKYFIFSGIALGLAIGTKISALIFGFPVFLVFIFNFAGVLKNKNKLINLGKLFLKNLIFIIFLVLLVLLTSPYLIFAFKESRDILLYETSIATGKSAIFYTRQFIDTIPVLFQLQKIFPFTLGWPIFILGIMGSLLAIFSLSKKNKYSHSITNHQLLITVFAFLFYFFSQAFLFTKWARFMSPIFAFFPIFAVFPLSHLSNSRYLRFLVVVSCLPGLLFSSIYFLPDIRFTASEWIYKNIPSGSHILYDTGNVVDIPVRPPNYQLITNYSSVSFDFYRLDENSELFPKLLNHLGNSDYIIVPSRRIFANHLRFPERYPLSAKYYELLFSGRLGFAPVAKIEPFYSKIFKDEQAEETFSVFDHPTVRIYKKYDTLSKLQYEILFKN